VKNRLWDKKEGEKCESRGVCEKNKENIWKGKNDIEKSQKEINIYIDRNRKEAVKYKVKLEIEYCWV